MDVNKQLNELKENRNKWVNEIKKTMQHLKGKIHKDMETLKNNQSEINSSLSQIKISIENLENRWSKLETE
jgi:predicted  nucleic acid-binding Zn-ribbon protein